MGSFGFNFWLTLYIFLSLLRDNVGFNSNKKVASVTCHNFKDDSRIGILKSKGLSKLTAAAVKVEGSNEENAVVEKGLTHLKYNKYAPPPEEAANMTAEEFRANIYKKMKEAEAERRKAGPIGNVNSDNYLDSLSRPPSDN